MDIVVRGKNRSVPGRLRATTREKVAKIARFTHDAGRVEVDFSEVHTARIDDRQLCEITVHLKRRFLKAHAAPNGDLSLRPVVKEKTENASSQSFPHGRTEANEPQTPIRLALNGQRRRYDDRRAELNATAVLADGRRCGDRHEERP